MKGRGLGPGKIRRVRRAGGFVYRLDWTDADGKRHRESVGTDRRTAEQIRNKRMRERDLRMAGLSQEVNQERSLSDLRHSYMTDLASRTCEAHTERTRGCLERVLTFLGVRSVRELMPEAVLEYRRSRQRADIAHRTINKEVGSLKAMLGWAAGCGLIAQNPLAALSRLPEGATYQKHHRRDLSEEELQKLVTASRVEDQVGHERCAAIRTIRGGTRGPGYAKKPHSLRVPQTPMWITLIETGIRWSELSRLVWGDFDSSRPQLTLQAANTKSRRSRPIPLRTALADELVALRVLHHRLLDRLPRADEPIFLSPMGKRWKQRRNALANLRRLLTSAGIPRKDDRGRVVDIHALRHTCGTRHARGRSPLQNTQKLLGHSDPKLTASTYSHIEGDDLRADVEGLPSLEPVVRIETHLKAVGAEGSSPSGSKLARAISEQEPAKDAAALTASPTESNGWGQRRELNPQHLLYESSALPLSYSGNGPRSCRAELVVTSERAALGEERLFFVGE